MKKFLLASLASISLFGADHNLYNSSLSLVGGYAVNSSETDLGDKFTWGMRYNYNRATVEGGIDIDAIQFTFDYIDETNFQNIPKGVVNGKTSVTRIG